MHLRSRGELLLRTPYSPVQVRGTLRAHTIPARGGGATDVPIFCGDIPYNGQRFTISPMPHGRNSWRPVLRCTLWETASGAELAVSARCHGFTRVFMAVWYGLLVFITLVTAAGLALGDRPKWAMLAIPGMWAWGWTLSHVAFWRPMNRAKNDLCRLLDGEWTDGSKR